MNRPMSPTEEELAETEAAPSSLDGLLAELAAPPGKGLAAGDRVGRFEIIRHLGRGGFGVVYEARDPELGRRVALKAVRIDRAGNRELLLQLFKNEAEAAARLNHPNVVTVHEFGTHEGMPYVIFELAEGETLAARLSRGKLPPREAAGVMLQVLHGLQHAHASGVVHRDLKPANVFCRADGQVKILDFGLAALRGPMESAGDGQTSSPAGGTPAYMAPEQWQGSGEDARTDIFAAGVMLYQLLTGKLPFRVRSDQAAPPPLRGVAHAAIIQRALARDPGDRFPSAEAFARALSPRSRRRVATLAAIALGAGVAAAALVFGRASEPAWQPQLTRHTGMREQLFAPHVSLDGRTVVVASTRSGDYDVWLLDLASGTWRALTQDSASDQSPAFIAGGREVLFWSLRDRRGLYRVPVDGSAPPRFVLPVFDHRVSVSGDGRRAAVRSADLRGIDLYDVEAGTVRPVFGAPPDVALERFGLSPDGHTLWVLLEPGPSLLVDVETGARRELGALRGRKPRDLAFVPGGSVVFSDENGVLLELGRDDRPRVLVSGVPAIDPIVAPDGRLFFLADGGYAQHIFGWRPDSGWRLVSDRDHDDFHVSTDRDGRILTVGAARANTEVEVGRAKLAEPRGPFRTIGDVDLASASLAPDGSALAATVVTGGGTELAWFTLDGRPLPGSRPRLSPVCGLPTVSADGRVAAVADGDALVLYSRDGSEVRRVSTKACRVLFSPTAPSQIVALEHDGGDPEVAVVWLDLSRADRRVIGRTVSRMAAAAWYPDGRHVAFMDGEGWVQRVSIDGGPQERVVKRPTPYLFEMAFLPDGTLLAVGDEGSSQLVSVDNFASRPR